MVWTDERLPTIALVLALAAALSSLGWQGYEAWKSLSAERVERVGMAPPPMPVMSAPAINLATLDLFGLSAAPEQQVTQNLPETNLQITLRGVSAGTDEKSGWALIEGPDRETSSYRVGDNLPGNAKLTAVFRDRVVVDRSGRLENLMFPEDTDSGSPLLMATPDASADTGYDTSSEAPSYEEPAYDQPVYEQPMEESVDTSADYSGSENTMEAAPIDAEPVRAIEVEQLSDERKEQIKARLQELRERLRQRY